MTIRICLSLSAFLCVAEAAFGQNTPTSLRVVSATRASVQLQWTGDASATNGYSVERQTLGGSDFVSIGTFTASTATDNNIDGEATYLYRVRALAGQNSSQPSSSVIAGPAPYGYNTVVPTPSGLPDDEQGYFGQYLDLALDNNGDPVLAYEYLDAQNLGNGDYSTSTLYFVRWSRAQYKWIGPTQVAITQDEGPSGFPPTNDLSVACDTSNGNLGIVYTVGNAATVYYAFSSDGGQTWKSQVVVPDGPNGTRGPRLAMGGGNAYMAVIATNTLQYYTGSETAAPSTWKETDVPSLDGPARAPFDLKVDGAGNPGIAFWVAPMDGYNSTLGFWRPGYANTIKVTDTNGTQNDNINVSLSFMGTSPRMAFFATRVSTDSGNYSAAASDSGQAWAPIVEIPSDEGTASGGTIALAVGSKDQGIDLMQAFGGDGTALCGTPKAATTTDFVHWTTCSLGGPTGLSLDGPEWLSNAYNSADTFYAAMVNTDPTNVTPGVLLYRQPPPGAGVPPHINDGGIVDGASFTAPVAQGAIATIFGTNFISAATGAASTPLPRELNGVTVLVNGQPAPLIYVGVNQINFQMPYETAVGTAEVTVISGGVGSNPVNASVVAIQPNIFTIGQNVAAEQPANDSTGRPVQSGGVMVLYATGCGITNPSVPTGTAALAQPLAMCGGNPAVTVGGQNAPISFAGLTPGFVGLVQLNVTIPTLADGIYPVQITAGGAKSNIANVTVAN